jgi:methylamine---glutamate N-methyltransferase subunit B
MTAATDLATELIDLAAVDLRKANERLHRPSGSERRHVRILHPRGRHNIAVGLDGPLEVDVDGNVGYYCAGMNKHAHVRVRGSCGVGLAENIMSGTVVVDGDASQSAASSGRGGLVVIRGNAAARCGISLKGAEVVVEGSIGHAGAFMAQKGTVVVCGDAGGGLGDSIYEARVYVRGEVAGLGADCIAKEVSEEHLAELAGLLARAGIDGVEARSFKRYGSARQLYHFHTDSAS